MKQQSQQQFIRAPIAQKPPEVPETRLIRAPETTVEAKLPASSATKLRPDISKKNVSTPESSQTESDDVSPQIQRKRRSIRAREMLPRFSISIEDEFSGLVIVFCNKIDKKFGSFELLLLLFYYPF